MNKDNESPDHPVFDPAAASTQITFAAKRLLDLLEKKRNAKHSSSTKEFAKRSIYSLEPILLQYFDAGISIPEITASLMELFPNIPIADLKHALNALRDRRKRVRLRVHPAAPVEKNSSADTKAPSEPNPATPEKPKTKLSVIPNSANSIPDLPAWADGSDQRADESDDEYRFRKEIEGPPEARHKFIGEHKSDPTK